MKLTINIRFQQHSILTLPRKELKHTF